MNCHALKLVYWISRQAGRPHVCSPALSGIYLI